MRSIETADVDLDVDVEALRMVLAHHPVSFAILFGSHASGGADSRSDVDVAVEFDDCRPADRRYNDVFFGLGADLSSKLETDAVDLVDVHATSPSMLRSIFDRGFLVAGDRDRALELRDELLQTGDDPVPPKDRFDAALAKIDDHLDADDARIPASGRASTDE